MIYVDRSRISAPASLSSEDAEAERRQTADHFRTPLAKRQKRQTRYAFRYEIFRAKDVADALWGLFNGKCAYCESKLGSRSSMKIDHFRPTSQAIGRTGKVSFDHYWWLAYEWANLYPCCHACDRMKANRFPTSLGRVRPRTYGKDLLAERPVLLDPCYDRPGRRLQFTDDGRVDSKSPFGRETIKVLGLNRVPLVAARGLAVTAMLHHLDRLAIKYKAKVEDGHPNVARSILDDIFSYLDEHCKPEREFACLTFQFARRWLQKNKLLKSDGAVELLKRIDAFESASPTGAEDEQVNEEVLAPDAGYSIEASDANAELGYFSGAKRIERIEIRNFRAIKELNLDFPSPAEGAEAAPPDVAPNEPWMMILGENGTGKSSILQAVALALMGQEHVAKIGADGSKLDARKLLRRGAKAGSVKVFLTNLPGPITLEFSARSRAFKVTPPEPKVLLLGFGATRLLPRPGAPGGGAGRHVRVRNLFDPTAPLNDAEAWLSDRQRVPDRLFDEVAAAMKDLLMLRPEDRFERRRGKVRVQLYDGTVSLDELSDGFQSVVAMATDIMISLLEKWKGLREAEGIVLLDEIEVHLHPSWKIEIVHRLRRTFPRVTFLATTHDPLCLKGLNSGGGPSRADGEGRGGSGEIVLLQRDDAGQVTAVTDVPPVNDLRADQILTSPLFGLSTTRGALAERRLDRYSELLVKKDRTQEEIDEVVALGADVNNLTATEETPVGRLAEKVIKESLARGQSDVTVPEISEEIRSQIRSLLE